MSKSRKSYNETKQNILIVAERLFRTQGYDHTTLLMIADEVGIAQGTLGHHFSQKSKIAHELFFNYIAQLFAHVQENMPADCNRYEYHMIVSTYYWRELMKQEDVRDLFFHKDLVVIWEKENLDMAVNMFREIAKDFRKEVTEEDIRIAALSAQGSQPRFFKEFMESEGSITVDQFCYWHCYMTGLLANLDEATIKRNITRVFEIAGSIPPLIKSTTE